MSTGFLKKITAAGDFPVLRKPSVLFLVFCTCFSIWTMDVWRQWHYHDKTDHPFKSDVEAYYSYLPATFIYDHSLVSPDSTLQGDRMNNYTYGMALMYSPFFALAYKISLNTNSPMMDGYNYHFSSCIHWGSIFYGLLGLLILRNLLIKFFSEKVTAITLAIIFFGTNLFSYVLTLSEMSHSFLFLLVSSFLLGAYHWYKAPSYPRSLLTGFLFGLIVLISPVGIFVGLLFVFWMVSGWENIKQRIAFLLQHSMHLIVMALVVFLLWLPQLLIWKYKTGQYFYLFHPGEHFFWNDPKILNVLFSYRKGWLLYTPLMLLAFIGMFFMKPEIKPLKYWILGITALNVFIMSCWWDWGFGAGFGARNFIQSYPFLSLPLASFIAFVFEDFSILSLRPLLQTLVLIVLFSGICLNVGQAYQYVQGYLHSNGMTRRAYKLVFGRFSLNEKQQAQWLGYIREPYGPDLLSGKDRKH